MTTTYYEERLRAFADGKRLGRLAKAVRDPEDGVCDACGSALPRTLFGLKDTVSDRHYFVGQNCLSWLLETGLVARTRYRQSAEVAYRKEMEMRRNGAGPACDLPLAKIDTPGNSQRPKDDLSALRRTVVISETENHYHALVTLKDGRRTVSGRAEVPRWVQDWTRQDGGILLEPVPRPRSNAVAACVLRAYREARVAWRNTAAPYGDGAIDEMRQEIPA